MNNQGKLKLNNILNVSASLFSLNVQLISVCVQSLLSLTCIVPANVVSNLSFFALPRDATSDMACSPYRITRTWHFYTC